MYTPKKETANVKGLTHPAPAVEKEEETLCSNVMMTGQHHQLGTASTCVSAEHVTFWESSPMGNANFITGTLQLVIKHGDITDEDTDAIVSGTKGKLATRLREKFGRALEEQYAAKRADLQQQGIAVTGTYGPKNIAIIYMDGSHFPRDLAEGIKACLDAAEQWGLRIISLPALGAGAGGLSVSDSAQALVNAVVNKYQDGSGSIDEARLVLNDMKMFPEFVSTVKHVISQSIGSVRHADIRHTLKKESFSHVKSDLAGGQIPSFWEYHRPNETVKIVHLHQASSEYQTVKAAFRATVRNAIKRIARIQNPYLYHMYMAKKAQMEKQNPDIQNERSLWHGTAQVAIHNINRYGFSRSYRGKNATAYGDGVYFAVDASYSANPTYSRPDSAGSQYMYLCKVLVGHSTLGSHGMRVLPFRQWSVCYDSATDNPSCPSMYVIFHDAQVYPEYLIVFQ